MQERIGQRGFTLLEVFIVIAITGIVAGTAIPGLRGVFESRRLNGVASQLAQDVHLVRSEAVLRNSAVRLSLQTRGAASCYILHTGAATQCSCAASGPAVCTAGAEAIKTVHLSAADGVRLQANVGSILFDPLHGTSTPTGTLRVIGARGVEINHVVNLMGRVRSCSPQGAAAGYRKC